MAQLARSFGIALGLILLTLATLCQFEPAIENSVQYGVGSVRNLVVRIRTSSQSWLGLDTHNTARESATSGASEYLLGVGKADITGPVVQIGFIGFADESQVGTGLRQRLYARSFIVGDPQNAKDRFIYVVTDTQSGDTAIRYGILSGLAALGPDYAMYGQSNVAIVGTHSHSGPGAWLNYLLPTVTTLGVNDESYQAIVNGTILSIKRAHESLARGTLSYGTTTLLHANINRSPYAYMANPASERAQYSADVDKEMTMIKFTRSSDNKDIGILNWFPVHGTSLYGNNTLVTGDNKGIAMTMFEKNIAGVTTAAPGFVAGFSQANVGDTSPNILGAWCEDGSGKKCTYKFSLCNGKSENCHGRGPNFRVKDNGATSGYTIGTRQYDAARSLYDSWDSSSTAITGSAVRAFHTFQNMKGFNFTLPNGTAVATCAGALGYGFAGGTTDWPGYFDFKQGDNSTSDANPVWLVARAAYHQPSKAQIKCQGIKPILLDVGDNHTPYDWAPNIVDIQAFRVGQFFMIISPGEATTMSGRRWRNAVAAAAAKTSLTGSSTPVVVLGAPANSYTHYIATPEEYQIQRYEGASTLYGPYTLDAYIHLTTKYLPHLADTPPKRALAQGPLPPNNFPRALRFTPPVLFDAPSIGKSFGAVLADAPATVPAGNTANATFVGANPRNDLRLESTYAEVQQQQGDGTWSLFKDDSDWELIFNWAQTNVALGMSSATLQWIVPSDTPKGTYRFVYYGASKTPVTGTITQFSGQSSAFQVV